MAFLIALIVLALIALVVKIVSAPVRSARAGTGGEIDEAGEEVEELESAREAKYGEIRDVELDYRTGKLSREDYEAIRSELRSEALEILNELEREEQASPQAPS